MSKTKILIVDDTPTNLAVLFEALEKANYQVFIDIQATSALTMVPKIQPDLILLDVMMPDMDGFEACHHLKADEQTRDIPVIFITALTDSLDEVTGFSLGAVDYITKPINVTTALARINTHIALRKLQQELEQQNAELDAFAHTVAHDLKNPLSVVSGYAELLTEPNIVYSPNDIARMALQITNASQKAVNIIDELLLLAGVRKEPIELHPVNMLPLIEQAWARLVVLRDQYQGELILSDSWPTVMGYAPWVEEVWANYLSNGLKYGGKAPILTVGATNQPDGLVQFWVQDNGPGIHPALQKELFTEFTQLTQAQTKGHGLGLSIVQRIMKRLNGQVGLESELGQGAKFFFTLPHAK